MLKLLENLTVSYTYIPENHLIGISLQGIIILETFLRKSALEKCRLRLDKQKDIV